MFSCRHQCVMSGGFVLTMHSLFGRYASISVRQYQPVGNHTGFGKDRITMIWKITSALNAVVRFLRNDDKYRPERHYMRGPGPKARAMATASRQQG